MKKLPSTEIDDKTQEQRFRDLEDSYSKAVTHIATFQPDQKRYYLEGLKDGLDVASLIADAYGVKLAGESKFREIIDWIEAELQRI